MKTQVTCASSNTTHKPMTLFQVSNPKISQTSLTTFPPSPFSTMPMYWNLNKAHDAKKKKNCTKPNLNYITQSFGTRTVLHSKNEWDSHDGQFRSFQQCPTELLHITVVDVMEVVTSLERKLEYIVGIKSPIQKNSKATHERHSPSM